MTPSAMSPAQPAIAQLAAAYAADVARQRRRFLVFASGVAVAVLAAGWLAEIDLGLFFSNIHKFPSYIGRIFILDSGPDAGRFVLFDIPGWFWGLGKWLKLLADTLLIAYVATVLGAVFGFLLSFLAASNLGVSIALALRRAPPSRVLPHGAGTGLRADLRAGFRAWADGGRAGDHRPHHGRTRQAVL